VQEVIWAFKYEFVMALATPLAELLAHYWEREPLPARVLVPVPLSPQRQRERGYNQAALLARELSRRLGLPLAEGLLRRIRAGPPQARSVDVEERRHNVLGAFVADPQGAADGHFLLIDDVMTSGATLNACAQALREAGAASVWALTFARH